MNTTQNSSGCFDTAAVSLLRLGKFDEAWATAQREIDRLDGDRTNQDVFTNSFVLTEIMRHRGRSEEALQYLASLGTPLANDVESRIGLIMHRGYNCALLGQYNSSHALLNEAETMALHTERLEYHGEVRVRQAMVAYLEFQYTTAESLYQSVVDTYGERFGWYLHSIATTGVGKALMAQRRYEEAIPWIETAADIIRSAGSEFQLAMNRGELGVCYLGIHEPDRALEVFHAVNAILIPLGALHAYQVNLADIGNVYLYKQDYLTAISYYQTALKIAQEIKAAASIEKWSHNLRLAHVKLKQSEDSRRFKQ
jgi:tetratricopeptide (TPR) repeat protein